MRIKITSHRGHHECDCDDAVATALYDKLTGKEEAPLGEELRTKIPDTFAELKQLWEKGKLGYTGMDVSEPSEPEVVKKFDNRIKEMLFIAPIVAG